MALKDLKEYPDVSFIENMSSEEIQEHYMQTMQEKYQELTGKKLILHDADPLKLIAQANCLLLYQIAQYADRAGKMALLKYSYGDYLENIGALKRIRRIEGSAARTKLRFTLSIKRISTTVIPKGTRVTANDGIYFETEDILEILPGEMNGEAAACCKESGSIGNGYEPGSLTIMVDPVAYVDSVENISVSEGGANRESDETLAERIYLAPSAWSTAGPDDAYKYWVKTYDVGITDVKVFSPTPGIVEIYFLMQNGAIPEESMLEGLEEYLMKEEIRPLTDNVRVVAPVQQDYEIDVTYYVNESDRSRAALIQTLAENAVEEFAVWQREKIGRDINPDRLRKMLIDAGAKRVIVRQPEYFSIPKNAVAVLQGKAQMIYGGVEDD